MDSVNSVPWIVAGVSALVLAATPPAIMLVPRLHPSKWARIACYGATASFILCCLVFVAAMIWGIHADWPERAKACMMIGWLLTFPAAAGAVIFLVVPVAPEAPGAVKLYFVALGLLGILIFGLPALIFLLFATPGRQ